MERVIDLHELYNLGHLIEAALAYYWHYVNKLLLERILKYVHLVEKVIGPGQDQSHAYLGHLEIELALLRLFEVTKDPSHPALARYFIEERVNQKGAGSRHYYLDKAEGSRDRESQVSGPIRGKKVSGASIRVHLYTSAGLEFPVGGKNIELMQKSEWRWVGV